MPAHHAPDQAKQQQGQHHMPQPQVPLHGVAADLGGDHQCHHRGCQKPMKQTGGKIPDANLVLHELRNLNWETGELCPAADGAKKIRRNPGVIYMRFTLHGDMRAACAGAGQQMPTTTGFP